MGCGVVDAINDRGLGIVITLPRPATGLARADGARRVV